jgi:hypothetical protein
VLTLRGVVQVRIFAPSRVASQQGRCNTGYFKLQFEMTPKCVAPIRCDAGYIGAGGLGG